MASNLRPKALRQGDAIAVAVFSNGLEPEEVSLFERGISNIESLGFRVQPSPLSSRGDRIGGRGLLSGIQRRR